MRALPISIAVLVCACGQVAADDLYWSEWSDWDRRDVRILQYGPEASDVSTFGLRCKEGSGQVTVEQPVAADWSGKSLTLSSDTARATWPAKFQGGGEDMDGWAVAEVSAHDLVLVAFAATGRLTLEGRGALNATYPAERKAITRFFAVCG
ncbi:MAG: hypothetical protein K9G59_01275 [Caulobacter sp.]|nr:hypothetical protein [Caulobacter sp.]